MAQNDEDKKRASRIERERNILAGGTGEDRGIMRNVIAELFGSDSVRLSQVDTGQAIKNARQGEQDDIAEEQRQFENQFKVTQRGDKLAQQDIDNQFKADDAASLDQRTAFTQRRANRTDERADAKVEVDAENRDIDDARKDVTAQQKLEDRARSKKDADDAERDENALFITKFLMKNQEEGTLDAYAFERAGKAFDTMGIPVEEYGPIFEQAMEDPSVLPAYLSGLSKNLKDREGRVKRLGPGVVWTRADGSQYERLGFTDGHHEDVEIDAGDKRNKDILGAGRIDASQERNRLRTPEIRGLIKEAEELGKARGILAAEDFPISKTDIARQKSKIRSQVASSDRALNAIAAARKQIGSLSTGLVGGVTSGVPGLPGFKLEKRLQIAVSQAFRTNIQEMRDLSKTGGAVGNVSDKDVEIMSSMDANLDVGQGADQLNEQLDTMEEFILTSRTNIDKAFSEDQGARDRVAKADADKASGVDDVQSLVDRWSTK